MLRCAVLRCAVLCCAVPCCAALRCAVRCCALCFADCVLQLSAKYHDTKQWKLPSIQLQLCNEQLTVSVKLSTKGFAFEFESDIVALQVRTFYTAPTLIRALEAAGDKFVTERDLSSLQILGTVGEPINAKAWNWYNKVIGGGRCPIVDTWWQTETGAILLTPLPGAWSLKPGSATLPFFGVQPVLLDEKVRASQLKLTAVGDSQTAITSS